MTTIITDYTVAPKKPVRWPPRVKRLPDISQGSVNDTFEAWSRVRRWICYKFTIESRAIFWKPVSIWQS